MSDLFTEVLQNYLNDEEWRQNVEVFVSANCVAFEDVDSHSHEQHQLWRLYQEVVDQVLEMALSAVGGSIDKLERALDKLASTPAKGPRDSSVKEIIAQLLTYSSFADFSHMMHRAQQNMNDNPRIKHNILEDSPVEKHRETLLLLDFPESLIDLVLGDTVTECSLEDLVMRLSGMQADRPKGQGTGPGQGVGRKSSSMQAKANNFHKSKSDSNKKEKREKEKRSTYYDTEPIEDSQSSYGSHVDSDNRHKSSSESSNKTSEADKGAESTLRHLVKFAECGKLKEDVNELYSKFVIARSVLDTFAGGDLSAGILVLLEWAKDMVSLYGDIEMAYEENTPFASLTDNYEGGLYAWFTALEATRRRIDEEETAGHMLSDTEMQRMGELDRIAEMGTEDERLLHSLISRNETVQNELNALHRKCNLLVNAGVGLKRNSMEELYLFLKEKVASGEELQSIADDMHEQVYSLVASDKAKDTIGILLDMHLLEDEQVWLRHRIQLLTNPPSYSGDSSSASANGGDNGDEKWDYGDASREERGAGGRKGFEVEEGAGGGDWANEGDGGDSRGVSSGGQRDRDGQGQGRGSKGSRGGLGRGNEEDGDGADSAYLSSMKRAQKEAIDNLTGSLAHEKNKQLEELEARLLRRRMLRKKELKSLALLKKGGEEEGMEEEERELEQAFLAAEEEIEKKIKDIEETSNSVREKLISGLKKRFFYETKAAKLKGSPLDSAEREACLDEAARAIRDRFERDQKALMESLEAERSKQKNKLLKSLAQRKAKDSKDPINCNPATLKKMEDKTMKQVQLLDLNFNQQEAAAFSRPQGDVLLALSAIYMDEAIFLEKTVKRDEEDEEDEERPTKLSGWFNDVLSLKDTYVQAGGHLRDKMRKVKETSLSSGLDPLREGEEGKDGSEDRKGAQGLYSDLSVYMQKVITDSFCSQITENKAEDVARRGSNPALGGVDMDRVKAGILEEFERTRSSYDSLLERERLASKQRLRDRKGRGRGGNSKMDDDDEEVGEGEGASPLSALFEEAVDLFLDDPTADPVKQYVDVETDEVKDRRVESNLSTAYNSPKREGEGGRYEEGRKKGSSDSLGDGQTDGGAAEMARIKLQHQEKERELIDGLHSQMALKKHTLQERLRRKRAMQGRGEEGKGLEGDAEAEAAEEKEIESLEKAFAIVVAMVREAAGSKLEQVDLESVMKMMEMVMRGEKLNKPFENTRRSSAFDQEEADRLFLKTEVQRISSTYNEEQQKLELMNKIQQTRQRQALQRKLMERKQNQGQQHEQYGQPKIRGLGGQDEARPLAGSSTGGKALKSGMQARGLSLLHMTRK